MSHRSVTPQQALIEFIGNSPTPFHASENIAALLQAQGFHRLDEHSAWDLQPGQGYYFCRGQSAIAGFICGQQAVADTGIRLVGAHTDSPCLKLKPQPEKSSAGYWQLGIEMYGGVLLNTWFDRDLSLAGRVNYLDGEGRLQRALVDFKRPIAVIPSLAIHLDREVNQGRAINPQTQMNAVLRQAGDSESLTALLLAQLREQQGIVDALEVLDFNLSFYDVNPPQVLGLAGEFIAGARLDNLLSCFAGAWALGGADRRYTSVLICNDHEEVGSNTDIGAQGTMLDDLLDRLIADKARRQQALRKSLMLSVDNAHGVHPNYASKHDEQHGPLLNRGPVVKYDANQSYATASDGAAFVKWLARGQDAGESIPLQSFVTRADMRCGSTIGPLTAANIGIKAVDLGVPTFAMHSIRELAGAADVTHLLSLLQRFYHCPNVSL